MVLEKQFGINGKGMGREQEKVSQRVEVTLLPRLRCPPSVKLGARAGKEGERLQPEPEKPARAQAGIHITHTGLKQVTFALVSRQRWPNCQKTVFSPA